MVKDDLGLGRRNPPRRQRVAMADILDGVIGISGPGHEPVTHDFRQVVGTELVVNQPDGTLKFFEIQYGSDGVPTLTYKYEYKHGVGNLVTQINYDYAGNLFVSAGKLAILSMPTENNTHTTPAKSDYIVMTGEEQQVIPGDVNGDGDVNSVDITILYNYLLNGDTEGMVNGDQSGDGEITSVDITAVYNVILGSKKKIKK